MDIRRIFGDAIGNIFGNEELQQARQTQQTQGLGAIQDAIDNQGGIIIPGQIGTTSQALTSTGNTIPNPQNMPSLDQGSQNACGTTSLAMIMSYLLGRPVTKEEIDSAIRRMDIFTAPADIVEYARDAGLEAEMYNNGSWSEVKAMIDKGIPVQALIQADRQGMGYGIDGQHYIAIVGYETDPVTGEEYVLYQDPNLGDNPSTAAKEGGIQKMPVSEFERMWGNVGFGFENFFIAVGPEGSSLPPGRDEGIEGVLGTLDGVTNLTNGLNRLYSPDSFGSFVHGLFQFPGGIIQTVGCGIGGLLSLGGQWLYGAVEDIPVLENLVQPLAGLVDTVGSAIGDIVNGVGEAIDSVGGAFESLFEGDFAGFGEGLVDAVGDVAGGVADAVVDVVEGVGEAIGDFFSGW